MRTSRRTANRDLPRLHLPLEWATWSRLGRCWAPASTSTSGHSPILKTSRTGIEGGRRGERRRWRRRRRGRGAGAGGLGARGATNFGGSTPLLVATVRGQVPLALFLLDHGADPNVLDAGLLRFIGRRARGKTGLQIRSTGSSIRSAEFRIREAKLRLVKALLAHGANPNLQATASPGFGGTGRADTTTRLARRRCCRRKCCRCGDDAHPLGRGSGSASRHEDQLQRVAPPRRVSIEESVK